ncbi:MAG: Hsp20/alpha crystallin family protein [Desulfovibrio sp.]
MGNRNWKPWVHLGDPQEALDRLMETGSGQERAGKAYVWTPPSDVFEDEHGLVFRMELPGVPLERIHVEVRGGALVVHGERPFPGGDVAYHALELTYGPFSRSFMLPSDAEPDSFSALLKDGILTLTVQRRSRPARRIQPE